jgi:hypothetical protein
MKMLLFGVCVALVLVASASASTPPQQLIGTWTRTVSAQDIQRAHAKKVKAGSKWTLVIRPGTSTASSPGLKGFSGAVVPSSATQVSFELGTHETDLYNFRVAGKTLTFTKYTDDNRERTAILVGVWKRIK